MKWVRELTAPLNVVVEDHSGVRKYFAEHVPDYALIAQEVIEQADPDVLVVTGSVDDGFKANMHFENGDAVYDLDRDDQTEHVRATLVSWSPKP